MKYNLEQNALNYLKELLSNKEIYCEELEDSYVMLKMTCDERNKLKQEKDNLIKWLEDKIREITSREKTLGDSLMCNAYLEILDKVKGGVNED